MRILQDRSLLAWSLDCAGDSRYVDKIAIVTNDARAAETAHGLSLSIISEPEAEDREQQVWFARSALKALFEVRGYDLVVVLDTGSPFKLSTDIDTCIEICARNDGSPVVSVSESTSPASDWHYLGSDRAMKPVFSKDDNNKDERRLYRLNRAIMAMSKNLLCRDKSFITEQTRAFIMPLERSLYINNKTGLSMGIGLFG
ncbi:MAG: hypothetical protein K8F91_14145 [Candidatus Obscuribacterales bacterium]|nr:hypothetical protein [Candidatus Obscuribacterales bacterium]